MEKKERAKQPIYRYIVAVITGFIIIFFPGAESSPIPLILVSLALGLLFGFIWSAESWRWGLWIAGPMVVLILLSVAFSGFLEVFLKKDLPIMTTVAIAACTGSFAGAWYKRK